MDQRKEHSHSSAADRSPYVAHSLAVDIVQYSDIVLAVEQVEEEEQRGEEAVLEYKEVGWPT